MTDSAYSTAMSSSSGNFSAALLHGGRISRIERLAIGFRILRIAFGQRGDQHLLARAREAASACAFCMAAKAGCTASSAIGTIDVGTEHQRFAPKAHGAARIELLGLAESALRFGVIESVSEPQPLIEIILRQRDSRW